MPAPLRRLRWRLAQFLEFRWWKGYLRGKSPTDYICDKQAYWRRLLTQLDWQIDEGARVLDAGCGPAGVFIYLADLQQITAIDPLLDRYERLAIFDRSDYPRVDFGTTTLEAFCTDQPFDVIYCFNAINHVRDWEGSLDRLTAAARPGTRLLLTSDVHRHRWLLPIFRLLPGDALHPQQHRSENYRKALRARGWCIDTEHTLRTERIFEYRTWCCTLMS